MNLVKCTCTRSTAANPGHLVQITYGDGSTAPACSCTVARYEAIYGKPSFTVTPVKK